MDSPSQSECRNRLLALMSKQDFDLVGPDLEYIELAKGAVLVECDASIEHMHFFETGIGSIVAISSEGHRVEVGLFGRDGIASVPALMGSAQSPHELIVQVPGGGYRLSRTALLTAVERSRSLQLLLLRYAHTLNVQTAFTALSNAVHPIDERLARWLLMCHDRHTSDDLPLTHEFLSIMLAVRRPSITTALHVLEGNRFIRAERGYIGIRNRRGLEEFAGDAYGKPEAEYLRLIGPMA